MSDSFVQVPPDSTGRKVDTSPLTTTQGAVERQRVVIGDDSNGGDSGLAPVDSGGLAVKDDTLLVLLATMLSRMPVPDVSDQLRAVLGTSTANIGAVALQAAQTLATVTTCSTVTNLSQMGGFPINTMAFDNMNQAANQLYNHIAVT